MPKPLGKVNPSVMEEIRKLTGAHDPSVIEGPNPGLDSSVLLLPDDHVLISSTDPISLIPSLGPPTSAWLSVHGVASDVAASGLPPRYALFDLNLPPQMSDRSLLQYWAYVHGSCKKLGITILGGHTGRFEGCNYTIIGGCTMFAYGSVGSYVTSSSAIDGDDLLVTKSAAIEATAVLSSTFPETVKRKLGGNVLQKSKKLVQSISTVNDSIVAASSGLHKRGVTAMHDVTEGGVLSAILDIAEASGLRATIDEETIPVYDEVQQVCQLFKIDPLYSLGQGCLVIASRPHGTDRVIRKLERAGIQARRVGSLAKRKGKSVIIRDGRRVRLTRPRSDPYWTAYWQSVHLKLP